MSEYKDFRLRFERRPDGFWVWASSPASGETDARLTLPDDLDAYLLPSLLRTARGGAPRGAPAMTARDMDMDVEDVPDDNLADRVGDELFQALFPAPIRDAFNQNLSDGRDSRVRIRLQANLKDPELARLASLPWELLYIARTQSALGRSPLTPIVRYLSVPQAYDTEPIPLGGTLRVLVVVANPTDTHALNLTREKEGIEQTLAGLDHVEVDVLEHATKDELLNRLDVGRYHVLHYMGHGGFEKARDQGVLFLEDEVQRAVPLPGKMLGEALRGMPSLRLVFLNACDTGRTSHEAGLDPFSGVASALVLAGVPAVVAMQVPISDRAALAFAEKFYAQLAHHAPVDAAVSLGRQAIYRQDSTSLEWATPVLFLRSADGRLFSDAPDGTDPSTEATPLVPSGAPAPRKSPRGLALVLAAVLLAAVLAFVFTRPDPEPPSPPPPSPNDVADIRLEPAQAPLLAIGGTQSFRAMLFDAERTPVRLLSEEGAPLGNRAVAWSTSDSAVARVSPLGEVTATGPGRAFLYARLGAHRDSVRLAVRAPRSP